MHLNCAYNPSPAGHCIISSFYWSFQWVTPYLSFFYPPFQLCFPPVPFFIISLSFCHFKSILTFILHPSIQLLYILPPPVLSKCFRYHSSPPSLHHVPSSLLCIPLLFPHYLVKKRITIRIGIQLKPLKLMPRSQYGWEGSERFALRSWEFLAIWQLRKVAW